MEEGKRDDEEKNKKTIRNYKWNTKLEGKKKYWKQERNKVGKERKKERKKEERKKERINGIHYE